MELANLLRGLAADPHARAVLSKAFREAPLANAAESLHALANGLDAGTILRPVTATEDRHPEDYCHRCGGPNISWFTPSEIWDPIMRPTGHDTAEWLWNEIICPSCFAELFEKRFPNTAWRLSPDEATIGARAFREQQLTRPGDQS